MSWLKEWTLEHPVLTLVIFLAAFDMLGRIFGHHCECKP